MLRLTIQGTWYGGGCSEYNGVYADLGTVPDDKYIIENTGEWLCGGFRFVVRRTDSGDIIYTATSPAKEVALYFDGNPATVRYDCINGLCEPSNNHGTEGLYASKENCELVCGLNPKGLICMSPEEYGTILQKLKEIENQACD